MYRVEIADYLVEDLMNIGEIPSTERVDEAALAAFIARAIHRLLDRKIS